MSSNSTASTASIHSKQLHRSRSGNGLRRSYVIPVELNAKLPEAVVTTENVELEAKQTSIPSVSGSLDNSSYSDTLSSTNPSTTVPGPRNRFPACHPVRRAPEYEVRELLRLSPMAFFFTGFLPPLFGAVSSIIVALTFHNDEISNYNWQCGRARLPSLSRIINLPVERILWQFTFLFHIPLRLVELGVGFFRYGRLRSVETKSPRFYTFARYCYAIFGILELIFMVALSIVGEREAIQYHVIFFYAFGVFATGFFIVNVICHANSLYYLNPYGRKSYKIKKVVCVLYVISVPILLGAFLLYWKKCITFMYDVFAIMEYTDVFLSIAYHSCAFYDIRHKVIFSIREVKKPKRL
uniref:Post-GPI attachment to proteins factor 2 n=1 Tax=Panagrellus redivivus TaxID=6233 RepID=A0A7E4VBB6_PANRE